MHVLGLDIGKDAFFAHLQCDDAPHALKDIANTTAGFERALRWAEKHGAPAHDLHVVMEATGVYWENCAVYFHTQGCRVSVVNPLSIKYFARSTLRRGKTDAMDAEIIARYGVKMQPKVWEPPSEALQTLKQLLRERCNLVETVTVEYNRLHACGRRPQAAALVITFLHERLDLLNRQNKALEKAIHRVIQEDPMR